MENSTISVKNTGSILLQKQIAEALKGAKIGHTVYEEQTGEKDENWEQWYAQWMIKNVPYLFTSLTCR